MPVLLSVLFQLVVDVVHQARDDKCLQHGSQRGLASQHPRDRCCIGHPYWHIVSVGAWSSLLALLLEKPQASRCRY